MMIGEKINESEFRGDIMKVYLFDRSYSIVAVIDALIEKGKKIIEVDVHEDADLGFGRYGGSYSVDGFLKIYGDLEGIDSYSIRLDDDDISNIVYLRGGKIITAFMKNPDAELNDILN